MKRISELIAIALQLHNEGYNFRHGNVENITAEKRITYDDALVVIDPLASLIDLETIEGGDMSELKKVDTRLKDIKDADQGFVNDPEYFTEVGKARIYPEQNIAHLFRRR